MNSAKPLLCFLLCFFLGQASRVFAQQPTSNPARTASANTTPEAAATATVSGHVAVGGNALEGVQVLLLREQSQLQISTPVPLTTGTDAEGNFRFTNVAAGTYSVQVYAPTFVFERQRASGGSSVKVTVEEGAQVQNLNFNLIQGGVITGKVTDPEGRPLIEALISFDRQPEEGKAEWGGYYNILLPRTDDRGVYRIFGLEPGRYLVLAQLSRRANRFFEGGSEFKRTYYPGTVKREEAQLVEVRAGSETENIDFRLQRAEARHGYVASGRVVEAETGKSVGGVKLGYLTKSFASGVVNVEAGEATTNSLGEFRFEHLSPGSYTVSVENRVAFLTGASNEFYAEPLTFELGNGNVTDLVVKMNRGTSISGTAVLEGTADPAAAAKLSGLVVIGTAIAESSAPADAAANALSILDRMALSTTTADGAFQLKGVRRGKYQLIVQGRVEKMRMELIRLEQNGVPVETIEVSGSVPVTNVRAVMGIASAAISGRVEVRGGALPPGTRFTIRAVEAGSNSRTRQTGSATTDTVGKFTLESLVPGTYQVEVDSIQMPDGSGVIFQAQPQTIVLADKAKQEVVLYVDVKEKEKQQ